MSRMTIPRWGLSALMLATMAVSAAAQPPAEGEPEAPAAPAPAAGQAVAPAAAADDAEAEAAAPVVREDPRTVLGTPCDPGTPIRLSKATGGDPPAALFSRPERVVPLCSPEGEVSVVLSGLDNCPDVGHLLVQHRMDGGAGPERRTFRADGRTVQVRDVSCPTCRKQRGWCVYAALEDATDAQVAELRRALDVECGGDARSAVAWRLCLEYAEVPPARTQPLRAAPAEAEEAEGEAETVEALPPAQPAPPGATP